MKKDKQEKEPTDPARKLGEVLQFMRLLWAVDHGLQSRSKRMESTLGITGPQRLVIRVVGRFPGISAGDLADILHIHPSTLTGVLQRLQRRNLIERKRDPQDARRAQLWVTARGQEIDAVRTGTVEAAVRRALHKVPEKELEHCRDLLAAIADALLDDDD
jgi:MarR family transcriptional regulator, organic hydroperoxide resistance regulator